MIDEQIRNLTQRVYKLELVVGKLQQTIEKLSGQKIDVEESVKAVETEIVSTPEKDTETVKRISSPGKSIRPRKSVDLPDYMKRSEYWLNKVGIGLLLFAVVFLFKYSVDQGWLTPPVRVIFGLALGALFLALGFRLIKKRRHFAQVMFGGAIATFYICGFAAFRMFSLVSYPVALTFMVLVTVTAYLLAIRQNTSVLSLLGAIGGLGTPFMLHGGVGGIPILVIFTILILLGTVAVFLYKGWYSLLWLSAIGSWIVFSINLVDMLYDKDIIVSADQWALQIAYSSGVLLFWLAPLFREIYRSGKHAESSLGSSSINRNIYILNVIVPAFTLGISMAIWPEITLKSWGWITLGGGVVLGLTAWGLDLLERFEDLAFTNAILGLAFLTGAVCFILDGDSLFFALATEATVIHLIAIRIKSKGYAICAHVLSLFMALVFSYRVFPAIELIFPSSISHDPVINARALTDLWLIGMWVILSGCFQATKVKRVYFIAAAVALVGWFNRELSGNVLLLLLAVEAVLIHVVARWKNDPPIRLFANVFYAIIGMVMVIRLLGVKSPGPAMVNFDAIANMIVIISPAVVYKYFKIDKSYVLYLYFSHAAFLTWFYHELYVYPNGQGIITVAWGIYSAILLVIGLRLNYHRLRVVSLITLFIVVGKLFLIDLAALEVLWRILLFMGFGGLFLFLSYYFRNLWRYEIPEGDDENITEQ